MDSKPGARTQEDLNSINKLAEPVITEMANQMTALAQGILNLGFTEKEAHHYVGYFLMMLAGRSAAFELQAEAFEKKIRGFTAMDLLNAIGQSQQKGVQNISDGFCETMERDFGLDRKLFESEVQQIMMERAAQQMNIPAKDSKKWN